VCSRVHGQQQVPTAIVAAQWEMERAHCCKVRCLLSCCMRRVNELGRCGPVAVMAESMVSAPFKVSELIGESR
jgi:hypothetical protein